jgi:hypothetical protein
MVNQGLLNRKTIVTTSDNQKNLQVTLLMAVLFA